MKLAQLPRRTASRLPRAAASLARRALSTQPASEDVEESVHDMLRQTCRDFVEAQVKPVAGELDQTHRRARRVGAGPPRTRFVARADRVPRARPPSQVSGGARRSDGRSRSDGCDGARGAGWDGDGLPRLRHRDGGDLGRLRFLRRRASPPPETSTPSQRALSHLLASLCTSPSTPPLPLAPPWSPPHHPPSSAIPAPPSPHPSPLPAAVIMSVNKIITSSLLIN